MIPAAALPSRTPVPPEKVPLFDVSRVAEMTGESEATVRRRCRTGQYPHSRWGRAFRFSYADLDEIQAQGRMEVEP